MFFLREALKGCGEVTEVFRLYEQNRLQRTKKIIRMSRLIGEIGQWENPLLVSARNTVMRMLPSSLSIKGLQFLYELEMQGAKS